VTIQSWVVVLRIRCAPGRAFGRDGGGHDPRRQTRRSAGRWWTTVPRRRRMYVRALCLCRLLHAACPRPFQIHHLNEIIRSLQSHRWMSRSLQGNRRGGKYLSGNGMRACRGDMIRDARSPSHLASLLVTRTFRSQGRHACMLSLPSLTARP
jgi:hypothetical protein